MSTQVIEQASPASLPAANAAPAGYEPRDSDEVAIRAYEIYCGRGCEHGGDVDDWIEAERQLGEERAIVSQDALTVPQS